jgi:hypothetical protein
MFKSEEGVFLCPDCPDRNTYLGQVSLGTEVKVEVAHLKRSSIVAEITLVDQDGGTTKPLPLRVNEVGLPEGVDEADQVIVSAVNNSRPRIVNRVAKCPRPNIAGACAALASTALETIVNSRIEYQNSHNDHQIVPVENR